jgi:ribosome-binding factor A
MKSGLQVWAEARIEHRGGRCSSLTFLQALALPCYLCCMQSKRQKQISELIRRQFSIVLQEEGTYIYDKAMVTVTRVLISPDLQIAKVYLSIFNTENKQEVLLSMQESYIRLRHALANKVGKQLRRMPELQFFLDDSLDEFFKMNELLNRLRAENQMGTEEE